MGGVFHARVREVCEGSGICDEVESETRDATQTIGICVFAHFSILVVSYDFIKPTYCFSPQNFYPFKGTINLTPLNS